MSASLAILGLGQRSTLWYLSQIHKAYGAPEQTAPLKVNWADFSLINAHLPDQWDLLLPALAPIMADFASENPGPLLVPNITLHQALDKLQAPWSDRLVHALELPKGVGKGAVVFGTRHTARLGYVQSHLEQAGWQVQQPSQRATQLAEDVRNASYQGALSKDQLRAFATELVRVTADSTPVIACTELSMAIADLNIEGVCDLAALQIQRAVAHISATN